MRARLSGTFLDDYGRDVLKRDHMTCVYCGLDGRDFDNWMQLSVDHVVPISSGGDPKDLNNQVTCCRACNSITSRMKFKAGTTRDQALKEKTEKVRERRTLFREAWVEMMGETGATPVGESSASSV